MIMTPRYSPSPIALLGATFLFGAALLFACGPDFSSESLGTAPEFQPQRPSFSDPALASSDYSGDDPFVLEAIERFRTGNDLHKKIIVRTCSPNGGVCHNQAEYPDLRTPANFLATISAPCNVAPGEWTSVDDRCERPGDRFRLTSLSEREIEIGYIEHLPGVSLDYNNVDDDPDLQSPGLHIFLRHPLETDRREVWSGGRFIRNFINDEGIIEELAFATFTTRWWILDGGRHLFGEVRNYHIDQVNELMTVGIVQGDLNRNGIFGASQARPHHLIEAGDPESSYLVGRMRGTMNGQPVVGSRMPLANQPLTISEMLSLFCFIENLPLDGALPDMNQPINYADCSFSEHPGELNLLGEGVTWKGRVSRIFQANCSGCHGGTTPDAGLDLRTEDAYEDLFRASEQKPEFPLIEAGEPLESYLWLKLINDPEIEGFPMPFNPLTGEGRLTEAELGDIETWIVNGAIRDE